MYYKGDFHVHSPFCPHGTNDAMERYVQTALEKGFTILSFTEHAAFPKGFIDPTPTQDSAMKLEDIEAYFNEVKRLKQKYESEIMINCGLEVDYLEGLEEETTILLNTWGDRLEDAILSVHMLVAPNGEWVCIDFSPEEFERIAKLFGSVDDVYKAYYRTLLKAVEADLGDYKPKRIGHITLIEKFSKRYPATQTFVNDLDEVLRLVKEKGYVLDVNASGFYKEYCGTSYPSSSVLNKAKDMGIPLIFGSDSHEAGHVGRGFDRFPVGLFHT